MDMSIDNAPDPDAGPLPNTPDATQRGDRTSTDPSPDNATASATESGDADAGKNPAPAGGGSSSASADSAEPAVESAATDRDESEDVDDVTASVPPGDQDERTEDLPGEENINRWLGDATPTDGSAPLP